VRARQLLQRARCYAEVMLTAAIVFGAVGVAAGFAWDFVKTRAE
jgi:hypothetical protein